MSIFDKIFGSSLANDLLSLNSDKREQAILRCFEITKSGSTGGITALEDAIKKKSNKQSIRFYKPGGIVGKFNVIDADEAICNSAKTNFLLDDIEKSQILISTIIRQNRGTQVMYSLKSISEEQLMIFQLLATHLQCVAIQLDTQ